MALGNSDAQLQILLRAKDEASSELRGVGQETKKLGDTLRDVSKIAAGFVVAMGVAEGAKAFTNFVGGSITAASDLGESINAVQQIFGEASDSILQWGEANATSFGLSQRAFNQMATPMGAMLKNLGFAQDEAAGKTIELTKRAADMASVFNTDVSDALDAINSALRGEANPIERYGVSVNQTAVNLRALADTGKTSADALTENEKAAARLALIFEQTASVAGDFQRTSGDLANAQRVLDARTEEVQAELGQKLLPVVLKVTEAKLALLEVLSDRLLPALFKLGEWVAENPALIAGFATAVLTLFVPAIVAGTGAVSSLVASMVALNVAMLANPIGVAALVAGLTVAGAAYLHMQVAADGAAESVNRYAGFENRRQLEALREELEQQRVALESVIQSEGRWTEEKSRASAELGYTNQKLAELNDRIEEVTASQAQAADVAEFHRAALNRTARTVEETAVAADSLSQAISSLSSKQIAGAFATAIHTGALEGDADAMLAAEQSTIAQIARLIELENRISETTESLYASARGQLGLTEETQRGTTASSAAAVAARAHAQAEKERQGALDESARKMEQLAGIMQREGDRIGNIHLDVFRKLTSMGVDPMVALAAGQQQQEQARAAREAEITASLRAGNIDVTTANNLFRGLREGTPTTDPIREALGLTQNITVITESRDPAAIRNAAVMAGAELAATVDRTL